MIKLEPARKLHRKFLNPVPSEVGGLTTVLRILPLYLAKTKDATPRRPLGPFHTDPAVYATPPETGLRITWFGHSSLLLELDGTRILIDPVWDPRASPRTWAGPRRFFAPTLALEQMPPLDAILISHDHYDHLGADTVRTLARLQPNTPWITSLGVAAELTRFGVPTQRITELDWTQITQVGPVQITSLPARHFSGRSLSNRFETLWASFVLRGPAHNIYYSADSGMWPGFEAIGAHFGPFDLSLIEIGAFHELWKDIHLGPDGAIAAFEALGSTGTLMPIHWGLFDLALHAWTQPIERVIELASRRKLPLFSPSPGTPTGFHKTQPFVSDWWRGY